MKGTKLQIVRRFRAPPERVFAACVSPDTMALWLGPHDWRVIEIDADVRVNGGFRFRMTGPQGEMAVEAIYEAIDPLRRLVHSWRWVEGSAEHPANGVVSRITYLFDPDGEGTVLTFTQEGLADQTDADHHEHGWRETLAKLSDVLEETGGMHE
jgi:uncharacterized protein YndB with AHSA1/START domain